MATPPQVALMGTSAGNTSFTKTERYWDHTSFIETITQTPCLLYRAWQVDLPHLLHEYWQIQATPSLRLIHTKVIHHFLRERREERERHSPCGLARKMRHQTQEMLARKRPMDSTTLSSTFLLIQRTKTKPAITSSPHTQYITLFSNSPKLKYCCVNGVTIVCFPGRNTQYTLSHTILTVWVHNKECINAMAAFTLHTLTPILTDCTQKSCFASLVSFSILSRFHCSAKSKSIFILKKRISPHRI